jgi:hypothetical protein
LDSAGHPHISYFDETNDNLKYAYLDGVAGWQIETVDTGDPTGAGDVGRYSSLALDADNRPHISYYDSINMNLKYAYSDGSSWHLQTADSTGIVGQYTSLVLDADNHPHISYYDLTNDDLGYAWRGECVPLQGVGLTGPGALLVGQEGTYQAVPEPITASLPLTFTWDSGAMWPTAVYSWPATGTYTITVTGTNVCGGGAVGWLPVRVLAEWPYHDYLPLILLGW